jgi:hypothetical protein
VAAAVEAAVEVHLQDRIEVVRRHVDELLVAKDARVVHEDVDSAPLLDGRPDDLPGALELGDAVVARHALGPERRDLLADLGRGVRVRAAPVGGTADVVHDDLGPLLRERECDATTDAAARAGDHGDLAFEKLAHPSSDACLAKAGRLTRARNGCQSNDRSAADADRLGDGEGETAERAEVGFDRVTGVYRERRDE